MLCNIVDKKKKTQQVHFQLRKKSSDEKSLHGQAVKLPRPFFFQFNRLAHKTFLTSRGDYLIVAESFWNLTVVLNQQG